MVNALYFFLIILVALWSIASGFRRGITDQVAALLGFAFGAVAARILTPQFVHHFQWASNISQAPEFSDLTADLICAVVIYTVVYAAFSLLTGLLRHALSILEVGIFNRILGAVFALTKNLLWLSMGLNILLCISSGSGLLQYQRANDGNLIATVMAMTPAFLGCYGAEDFALFNQLKEAKSISCNFTTARNVIITHA
ncbi:MAG: CvpA family protein [Muribaculaceae bacterium]|nr:CvpA family protein [Muribaculaceae bacterium]